LRRNADWASNREQLFAAAAAGVHLALFAWNLAFWGFEGMPHDRLVQELSLNMALGALVELMSASVSPWGSFECATVMFLTWQGP
jgi:hypothetical protein